MEWKNRGLKIDRLGNVIFVLTNQRLESLIKRAYAQTSQKVVVLIDEYDALRLLETFLSTIPRCDNTDYEGHYQSLLYTIFSLLGMYVNVEVSTPKGRVDMVMCTPTTLYVVELKLNKTADIALE